MSHTHPYTLAGSYPIALSVSDDDGGVDTDSLVVRVVTPEQAVEEIVNRLHKAQEGGADVATLIALCSK